ncbi:unnamed protein product, partial [Iphiclides podalirius]
MDSQSEESPYERRLVELKIEKEKTQKRAHADKDNFTSDLTWPWLQRHARKGHLGIRSDSTEHWNEFGLVARESFSRHNSGRYALPRRFTLPTGGTRQDSGARPSATHPHQATPRHS